MPQTDVSSNETLDPTHSDAPPSTCVCPVPWARLVAHVEDEVLPARPAATPGPAAALYYAQCATCGARYPGAWRVDHATRRAS
ncbi:hypothetical protein [Yinghuangia seranimata]|uniref:hypothetical protein n=1 Tax=Yinghuangia seranimata TaxID=408067 RepID=UPI00248B76D5|nr:hypothetical protein [Yinghuangia seranimata]MDI2129574.1 hypothetical protein [Yinghuangia seranimata]